MAHSLSAKKRDRQNAKRHGRNRARKEQVKTVVKDLELAIHNGNKTEAAAKLTTLYKTLDKVAAKRTIHPNTVARKKSRMAKRINKMSAKAAPTA